MNQNLIDRLFSDLDAIFSSMSTKTSEQIAATKFQWMKAFKENNINTQEQIDRGLNKARISESYYMPNCGAFISWCKQPVPKDPKYFSIYKTDKLTPANQTQTKNIIESLENNLSAREMHRKLGIDFTGQTAKAKYMSQIETVAQHLMEKMKDVKF